MSNTHDEDLGSNCQYCGKCKVWVPMGGFRHTGLCGWKGASHFGHIVHASHPACKHITDLEESDVASEV